MRTPAVHSISKLPQSDEQWPLIVHRMRTWIAPPDQSPYRPYLLLVFNAASFIMKNDLLTRCR